MIRFCWFLTLSFFVAVHGYTATITVMPDVMQTLQLSPQAEVSLITCSPTEDEVFTVYGHTTIRVFDPVSRTDIIYSYGEFDLSKPYFIYRFAKGETDYYLRGEPFNFFLDSYISRGSEVYEQILNLLPEEKQSLRKALEWNRLPENCEYRYNFFFDNCATRPLFMIENNIRGVFNFAPTTNLPSFRDVINYCTRYRPWQTFGCDLVVGMPADRAMTLRETFFIPDDLKNAVGNAEIIREGKAEPLVKKVIIHSQKNPPPDKSLFFLFTPIGCFSLLFIIITALTVREWRRKKYNLITDVLLFFVAGMAGCIIFFLSFFSVHPSMFPNINLCWLHPLHLTGIVFFAVKKWKMIANWYHFINFAAIIIMSVGWFFIPQHVNGAFIPLIACLWVRSGWAIVRNIYSIR